MKERSGGDFPPESRLRLRDFSMQLRGFFESKPLGEPPMRNSFRSALEDIIDLREKQHAVAIAKEEKNDSMESKQEIASMTLILEADYGRIYEKQQADDKYNEAFEKIANVTDSIEIYFIKEKSKDPWNETTNELQKVKRFVEENDNEEI